MTTSAQLEATLVPREVTRALTFAWAALTESSFLLRVVTFSVSLPVSELQDMMVVMAASSNFRHLPKAFLHFLRAAVMAVASVEALQTFAASTISLRLELVQQEQASVEFVFLPGELIDN